LKRSPASVSTYLFIVDDEGHSNLRVVGPFWVEAFFPVALKVTGIIVIRVGSIGRRHADGELKTNWSTTRKLNLTQTKDTVVLSLRKER
jgi:hypothetical protein